MGSDDSEKLHHAFKEVKDKKYIAKILDIAHKNQLPITVWFPNQPTKFLANLVEIMSGSKELVLKTADEDIKDKVTSAELKIKLDAGQRVPFFATFLFENANFFLKVEFIRQSNPKVISIAYPKEFFKLQRRGALRLPIPRSVAPSVTFIDPEKQNQVDFGKGAIPDDFFVTYRILDISTGGIALAIPIEEKSKFKSGQILIKMQFTLRKMRITADGEVRYASESRNDRDKPMARVGIKFLDLQQQFESIIAQYVADESRAQFSKMD